MLLEFSLENYRSFKERATLSLEAANLKARDPSVDERNTFTAPTDLQLLKTTAIYGPNASGKSNLIKAFSFMRHFVLNSSKETQADDVIDVEPFRLSSTTDTKPSSFEIVFCADGRRYRYGFEISRERVHAEWLYHTPRERERLLFERNGSKYEISSVFREGQRIEPLTRSNALFLSVAAQFNGRLSNKLLRWFRNTRVVSGLLDIGYREFTVEQFESGKFRDRIRELMRHLDLGITGIEVESRQTPLPNLSLFPEEIRKFLADHAGDVPVISTIHNKYDKTNRLVGKVKFAIDDHESEGTKKLFALSGPLLDALENGRVLIIDELDARLHPLLTATVIALFNSELSNPNNAQLVFTTHDTNLLSNKVFRRDQIWFVEKDRYGAGHLHSLAEFQVRNDASFERDYIGGRFGAIPFVGGLERLIGEFYATAA
jgi:uncharacterized protein